MAALMGPVCGLSFPFPLCSPFPGLSHGMASHGGAFDRRPERCSNGRVPGTESTDWRGGNTCWLRAPGVYCTGSLSGRGALGFTAAAGGRWPLPWDVYGLSLCIASWALFHCAESGDLFALVACRAAVRRGRG